MKTYTTRKQAEEFYRTEFAAAAKEGPEQTGGWFDLNEKA
jgi:hypothetical protein